MKIVAVLQRYRMLVVAYGIAMVAGTREYIVSRTHDTADWGGTCQASAAACSSIREQGAATDDSTFWADHSDLTRIVSQVNPGDPDTDFLLAMQALADGAQDSSVHWMEAALSTGVKHNEYLLEYYAQYELNRGADWQRVNFAVNRWRENFQLSADPLYLPLGAGPRDDAEAAVVVEALREVPWINDARLESSTQNGEERWRASLTFIPGRTVDIRQAVEAVSLLSLSPQERARFRVRCSTMTDCTAVPR